MIPKSSLFWQFKLILVVISTRLGSSQESQVRVGKALNVFTRFGLLGTTMRVIPSNEDVRWLFKEPTGNIYKDVSHLVQSEEQNTPGIFHGDFHIEFCDSRQDLFQAYFRDFTIELSDRPWEAFTGSWFPDDAAKKLGINKYYIQGDYSYVLVRVTRFRETGKLKSELPHNLTLENVVRERMNEIIVGNVTSAVKFFENVGTHYINSYTTGNSLYQVFVYNRRNYKMIQERIKTNGLSKQNLYHLFAPWVAEYLGEIRSASGNNTVERWARRELQYEDAEEEYVTLLKLRTNDILLRTVDNLLGNDAILQLDLKCLNVIFHKEPEKQNWFQEVVDNHMKLWEANMLLYY